MQLRCSSSWLLRRRLLRRGTIIITITIITTIPTPEARELQAVSF
ncbi:MAG: hypothetical protein WBE38_13605 [Terracidiphilus sp.]